jgi:hypothetical protein
MLRRLVKRVPDEEDEELVVAKEMSRKENGKRKNGERESFRLLGRKAQRRAFRFEPDKEALHARLLFWWKLRIYFPPTHRPRSRRLAGAIGQSRRPIFGHR